MLTHAHRLVLLTLIAPLAACGGATRGSTPQGSTPTCTAQQTLAQPTWATAVDPKPIAAVTQRGLNWLLAGQHADGGWAQGEEIARMGDGQEPRDPSNVADSAIAMLALLRASPTPSKGPFAQALRRGADFVCRQVEASDAESLFVTDVRNTRVQMKIGTYVDTFLASLILAELEGRMGDDELDRRVAVNLQKVVGKIERNQQANGAWEGQGWAPVLSQGLAGKALNRASQAGASVAPGVLSKNQDYFLGMGEARIAGEDAGVSLYSTSAGLSGLQEHANRDALREEDLERVVATTESKDERDRALADLERIQVGRRGQEQAQAGVVAKLDDPSFVSGFGSNGGEEFLSYMNISESLVVKGDDAWRKWDVSMAQNLERIQNQDGSWSGHHCITGRNFCTATALLVLLADRTPVPSNLVAAR
jgi:hypothetical protein